MTVKEVYEKMGANYDEVFNRLRADERIQKFLVRILDDGSYKLLTDSIASGDMSEAFRAAHTLKGLCLNFSLTKLFESSNALTEALRGRTEYSSELDPLLAKVKVDYDEMYAAVSLLKQ